MAIPLARAIAALGQGGIVADDGTCAPFERSTNAAIQAFGDYINNAGFASPVRTPRGEDIMAAGYPLSDLLGADRPAFAEALADTGRAVPLAGPGRSGSPDSAGSRGCGTAAAARRW